VGGGGGGGEMWGIWLGLREGIRPPIRGFACVLIETG